MWKTLLDLFFPINCLGCGQAGQFICPACLKKIPLNQKALFGPDQARSLTGLVVANDYGYPLVKEAIYRYKYDLVKDLAEPLGWLMVQQLSVCLKISPEDTFLLAVPLHPKRLRWRGFNQAELLAQVISRQLEIPLAENILRRVKYRPSQVSVKGLRQKKDNIKDSFQLFSESSRDVPCYKGLPFRITPSPSARMCPKGRPFKSVVKMNAPGRPFGGPEERDLKNKTIILVDDVSTTGTTLAECAKALKPLQPKEIWGLVIAHG
ncbi:MAG: hypothetical protein COS49_00585 [Candidatus Portnoybacteria bacterium CG03_land_8_20_14_0_80_41_10]|uniref:Phosphoribosyltransferase domain-containing protein n=1 Tax=Candidatus Portnoybacteria bacterium CG03_land_8_20_14_0_80_41_10 TaxID=1974808 RepID=A0A2M7BV50_9BACT|nr:MAG: hypothetical protein COS49_00585 [Candidatus Portnoybacteria bacterium CG03_land_8_20_14_0_80_41_10]